MLKVSAVRAFLLVIFIVLLEVSRSSNLLYKGQNHQSNDINAVRQAIANEFRVYMNLSADPCTDFYEFACGGWPKAKENVNISSPYHNIELKVNKDLQEILQEPVTTQDGSIGRKIKDFYASCMDEDRVSKTQNAAFREIIIENGGVPMLPDTHWKIHTFNWIELIGKLRFQYGLDILIGMEIQYQTHFNHRIYICEPSSTLISYELCNSGSNLENERRDEFYDSLQRDIADNLRVWLTIREDDALRLAGDIVGFEHSLCKHMNLNNQQNEWRHLDDSIGIDLHQFVQASLGQPVPKNVYIKNENYLRNLSKMVQTTTPTTVANYIIYKTLATFSFPKNNGGVPNKSKNRAEICSERVRNHFPTIAGELYNRKFYRDEFKTDIDEMWSILKATFDKSFDIDTQWMENNSKRIAKYKVNEIQWTFPHYSHRVLEKDFHVLRIERTNYWANIRAIKRLEQDRRIGKLHVSNNSDREQETEAFDIDVKFIPRDKTIRFPLGLLQPTFYHLQYPKTIKFGKIGFQMAREISHSFDEMNAVSHLWDTESVMAFRSRGECFRAQYSNYLYNKPNEFNNQTELIELIADSVGVNIAFNAYLTWLQDNDDEKLLKAETLPEFDFTNTHLFFLSFAQSRCELAHSGENQLPLLFDRHTAQRYRINGPLSNFNEFAREFHCLPGSDMNPTDKCSIF